MSVLKYVGAIILLATIPGGCDRSSPTPVELATSAPQADTEPSDASQTSQAVAPQITNPENNRGAEVTTELDSQSAPGLIPALNEQSKQDRPYQTLQPVVTTSPDGLIGHLKDIDSALQDLVLKGAGNFVDEATFTEGGLRLGKMKRDAGIQLATSPESNEEQRRAGVLAQLVALSHMSGLRDVEAAKDLERFAQQLVGSDDADLAHQARVVLLGFELQSLQNGLRADPAPLMTQVRQLFSRPQDRGFPEFMVLQNAQQVLLQMGFAEAAEATRRVLIEEYRVSTDPQLRGEAWLVETSNSPAYQAFLKSFRGIGTPQFDSGAASAAIRALFDAFPTFQTVEQLATAVANVEYSGELELSRDMANFARHSLISLPTANTSEVVKLLDAHATRLSLLGTALHLEDLVDFDGKPLDWNRYTGKVVLVDFWASWCLKCMRELPVIREAHREFNSQGLEVLSINMDEKFADAQTAVKERNLPWQTYHSADPQNLGFRSSVALKMGINAIPFMILVGRDGKVVALHVRGERLLPTIQKVLGSDK